MKARKVKKLAPEATLAESAAKIVKVRLDELRSFAPAALEPENATAQHDMRIAAKRLRYVLEITGFCFGEPAERARRQAKRLQEVLGELHDCDVMLPRVLHHLGELRGEDARALAPKANGAKDLAPGMAAGAPHRTAFRGLEVLATYLQARREILFRHFRELWNEQEHDGIWIGLERALDTARTERPVLTEARQPAGASA